MFKELKEDVEKIKKMMCEKNANINTKVEHFKRNQEEILELESTITELFSIHYSNSNTDWASNERIGELEEDRNHCVWRQKRKKLKNGKPRVRNMRQYQVDQFTRCECPKD